MSDFARAVEVVRDGFATPTQVTAVPGELSGCVHRADGTRVDISERFGGHRGDWMRTANPAVAQRPAAARRPAGRGLYLGHDMSGHYGHFITEGLGTWWILEDEPAEGFDFFLLHPFVFPPGRRPEYVRAALARFGISEERLVLADRPVAFDELVVPERLFRLNHSADPRLAWVHAELAAGAPAPAHPAPRIYLSRRRFSRARFDRVVANEVRVEALFRSHGFEVLHPEELPFDEQVALYRRAEVLAGLSSSALHNSVFLTPGRLVIELGDPRYGGERAPNQVACDAMAGVTTAFVPFAGRRFGPKRTMLIDVDALGRGLAGALGEPVRAPRRRLRELPEIGYLSVRPAVGHWAGRVLRCGR